MQQTPNSTPQSRRLIARTLGKSFEFPLEPGVKYQVIYNNPAMGTGSRQVAYRLANQPQADVQWCDASTSVLVAEDATEFGS